MTSPEDRPPLAPFLVGRRLRSLPAKQQRRQQVLTHLTVQTFDPAVSYDEKQVNALLREWCVGGEVDHVAVRRYLVDHRLLTREHGVYRRNPAAED